MEEIQDKMKKYEDLVSQYATFLNKDASSSFENTMVTTKLQEALYWTSSALQRKEDKAK